MIETNHTYMNRIGINAIGVNSINVPLSRKSDNSLIDCWFFKNKTNSDADRGKIEGVKGNILTLNGFAFSEMSGFGGFNTDFKKWTYDTTNLNAVITDSKVILSKKTSSVMSYHNFRYQLLDALIMKLKISEDGIFIDKQTLIDDTIETITINVVANKEFEVKLSAVDRSPYKKRWAYFEPTNRNIDSCIIEQIPLYPDSLVFDGIDDWAQVVGGNIWGNTVIMRCTPLAVDDILYDQRKIIQNRNFSIFTNEDIAYSYGNNGITYIDGDLNTTKKGTDLIGIDQIITIVNPNSNSKTSSNFFLGRNSVANFYGMMVVKYLSIYKEVLTPEQIKQEIDKLEGDLIEPYARYNLREQGATNETMRSTPILKNLQGNSDYDIQLNNFSWSLKSGVGGFIDDYLKFNANPSKNIEYAKTDSKVNVTKVVGIPANLEYYNYVKTGETYNLSKYSVKVSGLPNGKKIYFKYTLGGVGTISTLSINKDGIYEIQSISYTNTSDSQKTIIHSLHYGELDGIDNLNVIVEQVPLYPDSLVFDGVDDSGVCNKFPITTDYTVIAERECLSVITASCLLSKGIADSTDYQGAFQVEREIKSNLHSYSFGYNNLITPILPNSVIYQTKNNYCGKNINAGSAIDTSTLNVGSFNASSPKWNGILYRMAFWNRSLTDYELKRAKEKYFRTDQ